MATSRLVPVVTLVAALVASVPLWPCSHGHYEAAPLLSAYPERHPVKTMRELLAATLPEVPAPPATPTIDDVIGKVLTTPRAPALQVIDEALSANRRHSYEARMANLLWDLRDLVQASGDTGLSQEARAYITWRRDRMSQEKRGLPPRRDEAGAGRWWYNEADKRAWEEKEAMEQAQYEAGVREMEELMASSPFALRPHYMVQRGGVAFRRGHLEDAARWFSAVCWLQPKHPRAETALFMLARTRVEQTRQASRRTGEEQQVRSLRDQYQRDAHMLLAHYGRTYPQGRYHAEVQGWHGALNSLRGEPWMALQCYVRQLDYTSHPEIVRSASREIERCLRDCLELDPASSNDAEQAMTEIAQRPLAAMRVMGFLLDGAAVVNYEQWPFHSDVYTEADLVNHVAMRLARSRNPKLLSFLARTVANNSEPYEASAWQPAFMAILAWAASEQGEHAQAARLCEKSPELLAGSDDLQYCRAVVLQRMGRQEEALLALRALRKQFPESRLTRELSLRMARTLHAMGRDGEAIVELANAKHALGQVPPLVPGELAGPTNEPSQQHTGSEREQFQDVLEAFTPLAQLEIAARSPELPVTEATRLQSLLLARTVAAEQWADVKRIATLVPEHDARERAESSFEEPDYTRVLTPLEKVHVARTLAAFHAPLEDDSLGAWNKAVHCWQIAHTWEAARGMVAFDAVGYRGYMNNDQRQVTLRLRANALALGFDPIKVNAELDARDELRHTYAYCLRTASLAPKSALAAQALHKALECLKRMAEASPYAQARAFEQEWSDVSRQLYDRLQREHPDSPEAKNLAAWWTFPAPAESWGWMPGNRTPPIEDYHVAAALAGVRWTSGPYYYVDQDWEDESARERNLGAQWSRLLSLPALEADGKMDRVLAECASIRATLIPLGDKLNWHWAMSALDDAELIARHSPEKLPHLEAYLKRFFLPRHGEMAPQPEPGEDAVNPLADFIAYRLILNGPIPFESWEKRAEQWRQYLAERPTSLKVEAAEFQFARAVMRQYRGWTHVENHSWPRAPFKGRYVHLVVEREKPFEAAPVFAALDRYEQKYPQGRYLADIRMMRGAASIDAGDYATALRLLCAVMKDDTHRELHLDAGLSLAQCFELLHDPAKRLPVAQAIANDPIALHYFQSFTRSPTCGHRLRVMADYVQTRKN